MRCSLEFLRLKIDGSLSRASALFPHRLPGSSSIGRAPVSYAGVRRFEPCLPYHRRRRPWLAEHAAGQVEAVRAVRSSQRHTVMSQAKTPLRATAVGHVLIPNVESLRRCGSTKSSRRGAGWGSFVGSTSFESWQTSAPISSSPRSGVAQFFPLPSFPRSEVARGILR